MQCVQYLSTGPSVFLAQVPKSGAQECPVGIFEQECAEKRFPRCDTRVCCKSFPQEWFVIVPLIARTCVRVFSKSLTED